MSVQTEVIAYESGGVDFEGQIAFEAGTGPRPLVVVAHALAGLDDFITGQAEALADLGYTGFALDIFGKRNRGGTLEENMAHVGPLMADRALLLARLTAGLAAAQGHAASDASRSAAIGYCLGGTCVLDLARGGLDLRGVVSFHGGLTGNGLAPRPIGASVLAIHGHDDPLVEPEHIRAFEREMNEAGVDWQLHVYGGTLHGFAMPGTDEPDWGALYSERAHRRSWAAMQAFLSECLT